MLTDADIVISKVEDGCHKIGYRYHLRIIMEDFLTVLRIHRVITPKANFGGIRPCNKTCFITGFDSPKKSPQCTADYCLIILTIENKKPDIFFASFNYILLRLSHFAVRCLTKRSSAR